MPSIKVNQTRLHYRIDGPESGPVVMLSNSLAANLGMWDHQILALTSAGYRVLRYDTRGHGQSEAPRGPYTMEMLTRDVLALLDALELEKVHFCGLSMGGMVGQHLGAGHAGRLASLVLCSTAAYIEPSEIWDERIALVRAEGMQAVVDGTIERWFTSEGRGDEALREEIDRVRRMIAETPVEGFCGCCRAIQKMDQRDALETITVPTLVVVGEQDQGTPVSASEFIHERIASSELQIISGAAHLLNIEQAETFTHTLLGFLN